MLSVSLCQSVDEHSASAWIVSVAAASIHITITDGIVSGSNSSAYPWHPSA
jgi:hypothetical protein